jgi:NNP family nitrate/nitrite transporter-like MFS transporter
VRCRVAISGPAMTTVGTRSPDASSSSSVPARRTGPWIDEWDPEDSAFWAASGKRVA